MKCPKCRKMYVNYNFCPNCGYDFEMVKRAEKLWENFLKSKGIGKVRRDDIVFGPVMAGLSMFLFILFIMLVTGLGVAIQSYLTPLYVLPYIALLFIYALIADALVRKKEKRIETEFASHYSAEVELLRKAE